MSLKKDGIRAVVSEQVERETLAALKKRYKFCQASGRITDEQTVAFLSESNSPSGPRPATDTESNVVYSPEITAWDIAIEVAYSYLHDDGGKYKARFGDKGLIGALERARKESPAPLAECATCSMGIHQDCVPRATFDLAVNNMETDRSITDVLYEALKAVVRVADRKTSEFDAARTALARYQRLLEAEKLSAQWKDSYE